jgi:hypothetical protein
MGRAAQNSLHSFSIALRGQSLSEKLRGLVDDRVVPPLADLRTREIRT